MEKKNIDLSIIIPVFNGGTIIVPFYLKLSLILKRLGKTYEIIFIDDGSKDNTLEILTGIKQQDKCLKIINLSCNCGQHYAISKGVVEAQGEVVVVMDDDQKYILDYIPKFIQEFKKDYDLIIGYRCGRNISFLREVGTQLINLLISVIVRQRIHDIGGPKIFGNKGTILLYKCGAVLKTIKYLDHFKIREIKTYGSSSIFSRYDLKKLSQLFLQILSVLIGYNVLKKYEKVSLKHL